MGSTGDMYILVRKRQEKAEWVRYEQRPMTTSCQNQILARSSFLSQLYVRDIFHPFARILPLDSPPFL